MTSLQRKVMIALAGLLGLTVLGLAGIILTIHSGIERYSNQAVARFPGDRNHALMAMVECASCDLRDRNHAVWALGQTVVVSALPVLRKHFDGKPCTHESRLCQKELGKAIQMIEARDEHLAAVWRLVERLHEPWH